MRRRERSCRLAQSCPLILSSRRQREKAQVGFAIGRRSGAQTSVVTIYLIIVLCKFAKVVVATGLSAVGSHTHAHHTIQECAALRGARYRDTSGRGGKAWAAYEKEGEKHYHGANGDLQQRGITKESPPPFPPLYARSQDRKDGGKALRLDDRIAAKNGRSARDQLPERSTKHLQTHTHTSRTHKGWSPKPMFDKSSLGT